MKTHFKSQIMGLALSAISVFTFVGLISTAQALPTAYWLSSYFASPSTVVVNSTWKSLPKTASGFPKFANGSVDYSHGGASLTPTSGRYQTGETFGASSVMILPPNDPKDFAKVFYFQPSKAAFSAASQWYLWGRYGIAFSNPNLSQGVRVQVVVSGDPIDSTDPSWAVIDDFTVTKSQVLARSTPLGTWPLRSNFYIALQVSALGSNNWFDNLVIDGLNISQTIPRPPVGIAQSDLVWNSDPLPMIDAIAAQKSAWIRTTMRSSDLAYKFAQIVVKANQSGLKVLANVLQETEDYVVPSVSFANATPEFQKICGWPTGSLRFSWIDVYLFSRRFETYLKQLQAAHATVDAFEIGNELDWVCFNGDIPLGRSVRASEMSAFVQKYALVVHEAKRLLKIYSPTSKLITFGAANCYLYTSSSCVQDPSNFLAQLKAVSTSSGVNYLADIDGYGVHLYVAPNSVYLAREALLTYSGVIGNSKPFWVTEWGFSASPGFDRYSTFRSFLEYMNSTWQIPMGPVFYYDFNSSGASSLVRPDGTLDPASRFISQYNEMLGR